MIIYLLIIAAVIFFLAWNLIPNQVVHAIAACLTTVFLLGTIVLAIINFHGHYGMHKVNHTTTEKLASPSPSKQMSMLIYQPVGTAQSAKSHRVIIYKNNANQKKTQHTTPDDSVYNYIKQDQHIKNPKIETTKTKWEYTSKGARMMFDLAQKKSTYRTINTFYVPKNWLVLSANQAKALPQIIKEEQAQMQGQMSSPQAKAQMKQAAQSFIQAKMMQAMQKHPQMTAKQKAKLTQQLQSEYQNEVKAKAMTQLMPKVMQQLKKIK